MPLRIAIIGSGISGLGALWALNRSENEVHIYEAQDYVGGHTHTVEWTSPETGNKSMIDMAFVLFYEATYRTSPWTSYRRLLTTRNSELYQIHSAFEINYQVYPYQFWPHP